MPFSVREPCSCSSHYLCGGKDRLWPGSHVAERTAPRLWKYARRLTGIVRLRQVQQRTASGNGNTNSEIIYHRLLKVYNENSPSPFAGLHRVPTDTWKRYGKLTGWKKDMAFGRVFSVLKWAICEESLINRKPINNIYISWCKAGSDHLQYFRATNDRLFPGCHVVKRSWRMRWTWLESSLVFLCPEWNVFLTLQVKRLYNCTYSSQWFRDFAVTTIRREPGRANGSI